MPFGSFDILITTLLVLGIATGAAAGIGEMLWALIRWPAMVALGLIAAGALGPALAESFRLDASQGSVAGYLGVALVIGIGTALLQKHYGNRVLAAIPAGRVDRFLGGLAGLVARAACILLVLALLHPIDGRNVDWNPAATNSEGAVKELFLAILGSVRRAAIDESWFGQYLEKNWVDLLLS